MELSGSGRKMLTDGKIILRPMSFDDSKFVLSLRNDPDISSEFFSDPPVYDFGQSKYLSELNPQNLEMIIETDDQKVGQIRIYNISYRHSKAEYGVMIPKEFQKRGIAKAASNLILEFVFHNLPIRKIILEVFSDNFKAKNLYEKIGFEVEGEFKEEYYKNGKWRSVLRMALFSEKWKRKSG